MNFGLILALACFADVSKVGEGLQGCMYNSLARPVLGFAVQLLSFIVFPKQSRFPFHRPATAVSKCWEWRLFPLSPERKTSIQAVCVSGGRRDPAAAGRDCEPVERVFEQAHNSNIAESSPASVHRPHTICPLQDTCLIVAHQPSHASPY